MDYIYTAFHQASLDGTPVLSPLWFKYPADRATFPIDLQFFYGPSLLVSPVTDEDAKSVRIYLPDDLFYDLATLLPVEGRAAFVTFQDIDFTQIPLHIRGGTVLPLRANGAMTTAQLRETDFELVVAPDVFGRAKGALYIDDGVSLVQNATTDVTMAFERGVLSVDGTFEYDPGVEVARVVVLGVSRAPSDTTVNGQPAAFEYHPDAEAVSVVVKMPFNTSMRIELVDWRGIPIFR
jgi:alpha-glucosidase